MSTCQIMVIQATLRQENGKFKASLGYMSPLSQRRKRRQKRDFKSHAHVPTYFWCIYLCIYMEDKL